MFFRNSGNTNAWIKIRLVGTASNRSGIGAQVRVAATWQGTERIQLRQIGGFDSAGSTALEAHFGLADATEVRELRVRWPSGIQQEFWARTNPVDAQSVLRLGIRAVPQILWTGANDVTYQVRRHISQVPGQSVPIGNPVLGTGAVIRFVDDNSPDPYSFYSVEIVPSAP